MENPELTNAAWWYWFWELIGTISFFGVVVTLAIEFGAARLAAPYRTILDNAREERISAANERAAKAELELAKLTTPRDLTPDQMGEITDSLRPFSGTTFHILTYPNDPEPSSLALKIKGALRTAGWDWRGEELLPGVAVGIVVLTNSADATVKDRDAAVALVAALRKAGLTAAFAGPQPGIPVSPVRVAIQIQVAKQR